jgi:hypothetical protein
LPPKELAHRAPLLARNHGSAVCLRQVRGFGVGGAAGGSPESRFGVSHGGYEGE